MNIPTFLVHVPMLVFAIITGILLLGAVLFVRCKLRGTDNTRPSRNGIANAAAALAVFVAIVLGSVSAQAQVTPTTLIALTNNLPATINGTAGQAQFTYFFATNGTHAYAIPTNNIINLRQGTGMGVATTFSATASSTEGFSINWARSLDGTNWETTGQLQTTNVANGTNNVTGFTNFTGAQLNNASFITPYSLEWCGASGHNLSMSNVVIALGNIVPGGYGGN